MKRRPKPHHFAMAYGMAKSRQDWFEKYGLLLLFLAICFMAIVASATYDPSIDYKHATDFRP